jgi:hypothetical protein
MPKIYIKGETQPIRVSEEDANRILEQKNDLKYKGMIAIDGRQISKGNIKEISFSDDAPSGKLDLDIATNLAMIRAFEKWMEDIRQESELEKRPLAHPLSFYGSPLPDQQKFPGIVMNELLGGVHWTLVRWAIENNVIRRREGAGVRWAIVGHGSGENLDMSAYHELKRKLEGLLELRGRRSFAEKKEAEAHQGMAEGSPLAGEGVKLPEIDLPEGDIDPRNIPF